MRATWIHDPLSLWWFRAYKFICNLRFHLPVVEFRGRSYRPKDDPHTFFFDGMLPDMTVFIRRGPKSTRRTQ
jgi:hypothetical protein